MMETPTCHKPFFSLPDLLTALENAHGMAHVLVDSHGEIVSCSSGLLERLLGNNACKGALVPGADLRNVCPKLAKACGDTRLKGNWGRILRIVSHPMPDGGRLLLINDATSEALKENALREATHEAESARRARRVLMSQTAHEFRTPISLIIGNLELMLEPGVMTTQLPREVLEPLSTIRSAAQTMLHNINDMMELLNLEEGHIAMDPERHDLRAILRAALDSCREQANARSHSLQTDAALGEDASPMPVNADRVLLRRALRHLLLHVMAIAGSGGDIHISATGQDGMHGLRIDFPLGVYSADQFTEAWENREHLPEIGLTGITSTHALPLAQRIISMHGGRMTHEIIDDDTSPEEQKRPRASITILLPKTSATPDQED